MLPQAIERFLSQHRLTPRSILVAVSGGIDSTALLVALHELQRFTLAAAHVNHHLRGDESDGDEAFVRELCARLGVPLHVEDGTLDAEAVKARGVEAAAREVRIARLQAVRAKLGFGVIATAHQQNDQAETVLMRILTGGGIASLRGIHAVRDDGIIRPLLDVRRADVEAFLAERGIVARIDRSNADPRFVRNRVRAMLAGFEPTESHFHRLPEDAWLRQALLHRHIRRLDPDARDVSSVDLERLANEIDSITRVSVTKSLELVRHDFELVLRHKPQIEDVDPFELEVLPGESVYIPAARATLHLRHAPSHVRGAQRFVLPAGSEARFVVRNRRSGDRFQPLGMTADKKLKDFLIDRKIAAELRERIPLLVWNDTIVWVAGVEIAEPFKVTDPGAACYEVWVERDDHDDLHG